MKQVIIGLRTATQDDINTIALEWQSKGYRVKHKTQNSKNKKLPYNGVLVCITK